MHGCGKNYTIKCHCKYHHVPVLEDKNTYQNYNEHYSETYTVPGAKGDWKLTILPKNTNNFGYSITSGDASSKK
jgi:hypothetical protein